MWAFVLASVGGMPIDMEFRIDFGDVCTFIESLLLYQNPAYSQRPKYIQYQTFCFVLQIIVPKYKLRYDLYSLPNIVRVVKSRRMRWAGHVARMGEDRGVHRVLVGKPRERGRWGDQDVDVRIILRWILRKLEGAWGLDGVGSG